jgi:hypothetical protein
MTQTGCDHSAGDVRRVGRFGGAMRNADRRCLARGVRAGVVIFGVSGASVFAGDGYVPTSGAEAAATQSAMADAASLGRFAPAVIAYQPVTRRGRDQSARPERELLIRLGVEGEYALRSDLRASEGDVQVSRVRADLGVEVPIGERSSFDVSFDNEWSFYDFSNARGFAGAGEPWDDVWERGIRLRFATEHDESLSWFVGADVAASGEYGADFGDSVTYGGFGGVNYRFSETFFGGIGLFARSRLEDDFFFLPGFVFSWRFAPQWSLSTLTGRGLELAYSPSESLKLYLRGSYDSREFRLDDDGPSPDGVGRDRRVPVALGAEWDLSDNVTIGGEVGAYVWQKYKLGDKQGTKVAEYEADPTAFFVLELRVAF